MKAVFVGKINESNLYYIVDARDKKSDGVIVGAEGKPLVVSFWDSVMNAQSIRKVDTTKFHKWLWEKPSKELKDRWYRNFVSKTQDIEENLLNGVETRTDLMNQKNKAKSIADRADTFKTLNKTQNVKLLRDYMRKSL